MSGQEESCKRVTEKMALPRVHVAGMLPKAYDAEKMSPRDHIWTPASLPPGPGFRPLRSPWGKIAGPVALYGTVVEGWRGLGVQRQGRRAEDATNPPSAMPGQRTCWTAPERG